MLNYSGIPTSHTLFTLSTLCSCTYVILSIAIWTNGQTANNIAKCKEELFLTSVHELFFLLLIFFLFFSFCLFFFYFLLVFCFPRWEIKTTCLKALYEEGVFLLFSQGQTWSAAVCKPQEKL